MDITETRKSQVPKKIKWLKKSGKKLYFERRLGNGSFLKAISSSFVDSFDFMIEKMLNSSEDWSFSFLPFLRYLLPRIAVLTGYCSGEIDFDVKTLSNRGHWIRSKESNLFPINFEESTQSPKGAQKVVGLTGSIVSEGAVEKYFPFLILGQYLHAGKEATYGFGKYRISEG